MIYLFYWEKHFRNKLLNTWKDSFSSKFSELNIFHVKNFLDHDLNFYSQNFLGNSFFSTKTLFIIDDFPFNVWEKDKEVNEYSDFFLNILDKVNKENIIIFNNQNVDKRSKLFKKISEVWEIKDFSIKDREDLKEKIKWVYWEFMTLEAINKIIELKWEDFLAIENEIEKLLLTKTLIELNDLKVVDYSVEESIFSIVDNILNLEIKVWIKRLRELSKSLDNNFLLYNSLLSNLRVYFYIFNLKSLWLTKDEIVSRLNLWNRWFLVWRSYKINPKKFFKIYDKLAGIDEKMKAWKLIWNGEEDFMYEIEKVLIVESC